jgi:hypothetical protein
MDEEDGRPGSRARQFGPADAQPAASPDALPISLCRTALRHPPLALPARSHSKTKVEFRRHPRAVFPGLKFASSEGEAP